MGLSQTGNDIIGALGGVVLVVCLLPQIWRMYTTRSAFDLSYAFLGLYVIGLTFTGVYMIFEDALVGWICVMFEVGLVILMLAGKIYLDHWGPHSARGNKKSTAALGIASTARLELHRFLGGQGGSPFLLLQAEKAHAAAHLLLDCRLPKPSSIEVSDKLSVNGKGNNKFDNSNGVDIAALESGTGVGVIGTAVAITSQTASPTLTELADLLEEALENGGVDVQRRQTLAFPSFKRSNTKGDQLSPTTATAAPPPSMCFIPCNDGYVTAMWFSDRRTLSVDYVGAAPEVISSMNNAAMDFCEKLIKVHPGTTIAASAMSRLPVDS